VSIFDFTKLHVPVSFFARGMAAVLPPAQPQDASPLRQATLAPSVV
jgi:hypothetical protein